MRKNKMMRLASALLVAVLLTTSVISGTYAKYVTSKDADDTARVAKWGVQITVQGDEAFSEAYLNGQNSEGTEKTADESTTTVVTSTTDTTDKVVAPGTTGKLASVTITGKPEVDVSVSVIATLSLEGWTIADGEDEGTDPDFYCPLVFKCGDTTVDGKTFTSAEALQTAVVALMNKSAAQVTANTQLDTTYDSVVTWSWPYSTSDANDVKDTNLGNNAAGLNSGTAAKITSTITATVTQID